MFVDTTAQMKNLGTQFCVADVAHKRTRSRAQVRKWASKIVHNFASVKFLCLPTEVPGECRCLR